MKPDLVAAEPPIAADDAGVTADAATVSAEPARPTNYFLRPPLDGRPAPPRPRPAARRKNRPASAVRSAGQKFLAPARRTPVPTAVIVLGKRGWRRLLTSETAWGWSAAVALAALIGLPLAKAGIVHLLAGPEPTAAAPTSVPPIALRNAETARAADAGPSPEQLAAQSADERLRQSPLRLIWVKPNARGEPYAQFIVALDEPAPRSLRKLREKTTYAVVGMEVADHLVVDLRGNAATLSRHGRQLALIAEEPGSP
jgi:hypothetical protein